MHCPDSKILWSIFAAGTNVEGYFLQIKEVYKWWRDNVATKLKALFRVVPMFILWQIWKRRNIVSMEDKCLSIA